jgi:copper chaperone NosL
MVALRLAIAAVLLAALGCSSSSKPIDVRAGDTCAHCRMAVSNARFAGQIAAPGEEPLFFDDIGCLVKALGGKPLDHAYVSDHRTREWIPAKTALYTRVPALETPMGSHIIAHANERSRRADADATGGKPMTADEVFSRASAGDGHGH